LITTVLVHLFNACVRLQICHWRATRNVGSQKCKVVGFFALNARLRPHLYVDVQGGGVDASGKAQAGVAKWMGTYSSIQLRVAAQH
jgi:hypothetical protein